MIVPRKVKGYRSRAINGLIDCVIELFPLPTPTILREFTPSGVKLNAITEPAGGNSDDKTFGTSIAGLKCTIRAGTLHIHSASIEAEYAGGTVDLTGNPCWVYVNYPRGGSTITVQVSSTKPVSDTSTLRVILCKCNPNATYTAYAKAYTNHDGDINLDSPLS